MRSPKFKRTVVRKGNGWKTPSEYPTLSPNTPVWVLEPTSGDEDLVWNLWRLSRALPLMDRGFKCYVCREGWGTPDDDC